MRVAQASARSPLRAGDFGDAHEAVIRGEVDLECGTTTSTAERRRKVAFTVPTYIATTALLVRSGSGIGSIGDLGGKTVVTTRGTTAEKIFRDANERRSLRASLVEAKRTMPNPSRCCRPARPTRSSWTTCCSTAFVPPRERPGASR